MKNSAKIGSFIFLVFFVVGLFFLSPNLTGNSIGNFSDIESNVLGIALVVLGVVGYYFYLRFVGSYL